MTKRLPTDRTIFQNAWVVDDAEATAMRWVDEFGVGPFYFAEHSENLTDVLYRGEPSELSMIVALSQAGPVQIELIQPTTDKPCAYRDSVEPGTVGFHHMCVWTHDIDADTEYFEQLGYPTANIGDAGHVRFAYYDTRPLMGCMLEVVEHRPSIAEHFEQIAEAAKHWDGSRPLRSRGEF
ncbi:MAG: VOC family protein [Acidimicrobiales bacterium]